LDEMMYALYWTNRLCWSFILRAQLKQDSTGRHVAPRWHIFLMANRPVFACNKKCVYYCSIFHSHIRVFNNKHNSSPIMNENRPLAKFESSYVLQKHKLCFLVYDPYVTVKYRTVIHTFFIYFNLCLSVKCSFTSISFHSKTKTNQVRKADFHVWICF
jgi:hypothetical protein